MTAQTISADFFAGYLGEKDAQLDALQQQMKELQQKISKCKQEKEVSQDSFESILRYCLSRFAAAPDIVQATDIEERRSQRVERFDEWSSNILDAPTQASDDEAPAIVKFPVEDKSFVENRDEENAVAESDNEPSSSPVHFESAANWEDVEWDDDEEDDDCEDEDEFYVDDDSIEWTPVDDDLAAEMEREEEERERRRQELLVNPPVEKVPEGERIKPRGVCYVKPRPNDDFDCDNRAALTAVVCKKLRFPTSDDEDVDQTFRRKIVFFGAPVNSVDLKEKARAALKYMIESQTLSVNVKELATNLGWSDEDAVEACRDLQAELGFSFPGLAGEFVSPHLDGAGWVPWEDLEFKLYRYAEFEETYETKFLACYRKACESSANCRR